MGNTSNDLLLLQQGGEGSRNAFDLLFMRYYPKLKLYLTRLIGSANEAEDMAQEIFFKIWTIAPRPYLPKKNYMQPIWKQ